MSTALNYLKNIILITVLIGALTVLSVAINTLIPWDYLTLFFVLFRTILIKISWFINIDTTFLIMLISFSINILLWSFRGVLTLLNYFNGD